MCTQSIRLSCMTLVVLTGCIVLCAGPVLALEGVQSYTLPTTPNGLHPLQCWYAVGSAPDGSIYAAGCDHTTNSALYCLRPGAKAFQYVGDAKSASQRANNWKPSETCEKFHVRPTYLDGKVYVGGLDFSVYSPGFLKRRGFHWYAYDTHKDTFEDLSAKEPSGIAAIFQLEHLIADPERHVLYGQGVPMAHLLRYDPRTGVTTNFGRPPGLHEYFPECDGFLFLTGDGKVCFGMWAGSDSEHRGHEFFNHMHYYDLNTGTYGERKDWRLKRHQPKMGQWSQDRKRCYMAGNAGHIYLYDDTEKSWTYLGQVQADDDHPNFSTRTFQLSPDEDFIYFVNGNRKSQIYLYEYEIRTGKTRVLGAMGDIDPNTRGFTDHAGHDAWDTAGRFYVASYGTLVNPNARNLVITAIDPKKLKRALKE